MSDYGLKVRNIRNEIQIDSLYSNYSLFQSGTSVNVNTDYNFTSYLNYCPIILVRPISGSSIVYVSYNYSSNQYTGFSIWGGSGSTYDYLVYASTKEVTSLSGEYGLRIKNKRGESIYATDTSPFTISQVTQATASFYAGTDTIIHSQIENPYYIMTPIQVGLFCGSPGGPPAPYYRLHICMTYASSTSLTIQWVVTKSYGLYNFPIGEYTGTAVTIIVCGVNE